MSGCWWLDREYSFWEPFGAMTITEELREAEQALAASIEAMKTHGHQGITWALYKADAERVKTLRAAIAQAKGETNE